MKRFILVLCFLLGFANLSLADVTEKIFLFLEKKYPQKFHIVSKVEEVSYDQVLIKATPYIKRGDELLVVEKQEGISSYLYPKKAVIKVKSLFGDKVLASIVFKKGPVRSGDLVVRPFAPVIYLYSNIKEKDTFPPYQNLLQAFLKRGYEVKELSFDEKIKPSLKEYGILIRLEGLTDHLSYKIQSIYSQDTLFSKAEKSKFSFVTQVPAGRSLFKEEVKKEEELAYSIPLYSSFTTAGSFKKAKMLPRPKIIRLGKEYIRFVICNIDGKGPSEFAFLGKKGVRVYSYKNGRFFPMTFYPITDPDSYGLHIHAMDVNEDGKDDLIVTIGRDEMILEAEDTRLHSVILTYKNGVLKPLVRDLPYYLRVIEDRHGNKVLLGQKRGNFKPFSGDIIRFVWKDNHLFSTGPYAPAKRVYSIYQFNLLPYETQKIAILETTGHVSVYFAPTEKLEFITDKSYGEYTVVPVKVRLREPQFIKGGFEKTTFEVYYLERRFCLKREYDDQMFLINKQRKISSGLEKLKNRFLEQDRQDSIVALKWDGKILQQTWESKKILKDILDFGFLRENGEDKLFVLVMDSQGCAIEELQ